MDIKTFDNTVSAREDAHAKLENARSTWRFAEGSANAKRANYATQAQHAELSRATSASLKSAAAALANAPNQGLERLTARTREENREGQMIGAGVPGLHCRALVNALLVDAQHQVKREQERLDRLRADLDAAEADVRVLAAQVERAREALSAA